MRSFPSSTAVKYYGLCGVVFSSCLAGGRLSEHV